MMKSLVFYLSLPFLFFFSLMPLRVLHFVADGFLYPVLYGLVRYRVDVVRQNLKNAFPDKTTHQLHLIEKEFYHHLADIFVETLKMFTISKRELKHRLKVENIDVLQSLYDEGRSVVLTLGHYGNYEWLAQSLDFSVPHKGCGPHRKLHNPHFEKLFLKARSKFGTYMFPTKETYRVINKTFEKPIIIGLANDQSAPPMQSYWTKFLNQDTSFFVGTELIAKRKNYAVVYACIKRLKRGYYKIELTLICGDPLQMKEGAIMDQHAALLEQNIREEPSSWLWSHKRWKNPIPDGLVKGFAKKLKTKN